ncbi:MAG: SCO1664 family protein [Chloroflexi bacterium]|nr:MAG: SCO1664 family protein [Chloroflexota bacterium]
MLETLTNLWQPGDPHVRDALRDSQVTDVELLYDSSNYVFLANLEHPEYGEGLGIYKPVSGEAPLSDFPYGSLHRREVAAFELSRLLGWDLVPPVVEREGPRGIGSMQLFIPHDPDAHYFALRGEPALHPQYIRLAAFDLITNNADRKGGHMLLDATGNVWAIDNALCFHRIDKLRTVVWDFAGETVPDSVLTDIERVMHCVTNEDEASEAFRAHIHPGEVDTFVRRCAALLADPVLPEMYPWRCVPWPLV